MNLIDIFRKYTADEVIAAIDEMFPDTEQYHDTFRTAYDLLMTLTPVPSKKKIRYQILSDEENEIEYFGAEDSCFATTWEVCLAKEVVVDDGVELDEREIAANSLVNLCLTARCPRQFLPLKRSLLDGAGTEQ